MTKATKKLAKQIAAEIKNIESKTAVEQMATYFTIGWHLRKMVEGWEAECGPTALQDLVALVPHLKTEEYAYRLMALTDHDEEIRGFMLEETATPMGNGQHLTPDHWGWLFRHQPEEASTEQDQWSRRGFRPFPHQPKEASVDEKGQWLRRELAWLRKESPSAAVLEHVEEILRAEHERETDRFRESVEDVVHTLQSL